MHSMIRSAFAGCLVAAFAVPAFAADDIKIDPAEMAKGIQRDIIFQVDDAAQKLIELAEATPAAKFHWMPEKGVRTTGEVFLHVATANYLLPSFLGMKPPADVNAMTLEKTPMTKEQTVDALRKSFAHLRQAIASVPDADLANEVDLFGNKMTKQAALLLMATHAHEHLGQSIAYARMNRIVPPWTAREQAAAAAKKSSEKMK